jgi:hypothetical protein
MLHFVDRQFFFKNSTIGKIGNSHKHVSCNKLPKEYNFITRGVSHCGLATYIEKYLKTKEELWKVKYFTM